MKQPGDVTKELWHVQAYGRVLHDYFLQKQASGSRDSSRIYELLRGIAKEQQQIIAFYQSAPCAPLFEYVRDRKLGGALVSLHALSAFCFLVYRFRMTFEDAIYRRLLIKLIRGATATTPASVMASLEEVIGLGYLGLVETPIDEPHVYIPETVLNDFLHTRRRIKTPRKDIVPIRYELTKRLPPRLVCRDYLQGNPLRFFTIN